MSTLTGLLISCALLATACTASGPLTSALAAKAQIDLGAIPQNLPAARITDAEAVTVARRHTLGGPAAGPITGVVRAMARPDASPAERTVWVVVFGPGGTVPVPAIAASEAPSVIRSQVVVIDDKSGAFLRSAVESSP
jgi:hypothetical protein